jgi:hypothetical protein
MPAATPRALQIGMRSGIRNQFRSELLSTLDIEADAVD